MRDGESIVAGLAVTVFIHLFVGGIVHSMNSAEPEAKTNFEEAQTIEASLAFKSVAPKSKQPQKKKKKKFQQDVEDGASKEDKKAPKKLEKKKKKPTEEDEIDPLSVLKKNRMQDDNLSETGVEEVPTEGDKNGSEWGTAKDAIGDPYVGELRGRLNWKVPTLEKGQGLVQGCIRLNAKGKIVATEIKKRSKNRNLNRSVEVALKNALDMETPVPPRLIKILTVQGICFDFDLKKSN